MRTVYVIVRDTQFGVELESKDGRVYTPHPAFEKFEDALDYLYNCCAPGAVLEELVFHPWGRDVGVFRPAKFFEDEYKGDGA